MGGEGIEPSTSSVSTKRSTNELTARTREIIAGNPPCVKRRRLARRRTAGVMETVPAAPEADLILHRTACHEAGHALVACKLGIPFARVCLGIEPGSAGRVQGIRYPSESPLDPRQVEDFLAYLAAGAAAVELLHGPGVVTGGTEDRLQAEYWAA